MSITWVIAMFGLVDGFHTARELRSGRLPDLPAATQTDPRAQALYTALREAARAPFGHTDVAFPLAVAEAILSGLLLVASGMALTGRRGGRSLALQAVGANALLAVAAYTLNPFAWNAYVGELVRAAPGLPSPDREIYGNAAALFWIRRIKLLTLDLGPLAFAALALTRKRAKAFFEAADKARERDEEP